MLSKQFMDTVSKIQVKGDTVKFYGQKVDQWDVGRKNLVSKKWDVEPKNMMIYISVCGGSRQLWEIILERKQS